MNPKIRRISTGKCCKWCDKLDGIYEYSKVSDTGNDVFRSHKHCRCIVEYDDGDRKRKDVHTKKERQVGTTSLKEKEIREASRLKSLAFSEAKKRGYNSLPADKVVNIYNKKSIEWKEVLLQDEEKLAIEKYINGVDTDGKSYMKR